MSIVKWVVSAFLMSIIHAFNTQLIPKFYHRCSIKEFWKRSHKSWSSTNLVVIGLGLIEELNYSNQLQILYGFTPNYHNIVGLAPQFNSKYEEISSPIKREVSCSTWTLPPQQHQCRCKTTLFSLHQFLMGYTTHN